MGYMPHRTCPNCENPGVPVMFGMPSAAVIPAIDRGLLKLGGCIIEGDERTTWWCASCQESFQGPKTYRAIAKAIETATEPAD